MAEFLAGIEQLALVRGLKASFAAYPIVNALHIMSVGALLTSVFLMDLRIAGSLGDMPEVPFVRLLRRVALGAFIGALLTGLLLFSVRASEYAVMPIFLTKMALILLAGINLLAFLRLSSASGGKQPRSATTRVFAVLSLLLWISVLFAGRFIGFL
jgi:hypothetical protein